MPWTARLTNQQRSFARYAEVLRQANVPWADIIQRLDPRGEAEPPLQAWLLRRWIRQLHDEHGGSE